jgi:hypothetical protein
MVSPGELFGLALVIILAGSGLSGRKTELIHDFFAVEIAD